MPLPNASTYTPLSTGCAVSSADPNSTAHRPSAAALSSAATAAASPGGASAASAWSTPEPAQLMPPARPCAQTHDSAHVPNAGRHARGKVVTTG